MADPHIVTTLRAKRDEIKRYILAMEEKIREARVDLFHVNATLHLFEHGKAPTQFPVHMGMAMVFKRGELPKLCLEALGKVPGGMTTRELAREVAKAKGLDLDDKVMLRKLAHSILQALQGMRRRGQVGGGTKVKGLTVWSNAKIQEIRDSSRT